MKKITVGRAGIGAWNLFRAPDFPILVHPLAGVGRSGRFYRATMRNDVFSTTVYDIVRQIPAGRVATYGLIARLAGAPAGWRKVGRLMAEAPAFLRLPCHRVVNSRGRLAPGWDAQRLLLEQEGISFRKNGCVDLKKALWEALSELSQE